MAEGILQLLQRLNARYESVGLRVTIAQRQDVTAEAGNERIRENEYKKALEYCIKRKQRERRGYPFSGRRENIKDRSVGGSHDGKRI